MCLALLSFTIVFFGNIHADTLSAPQSEAIKALDFGREGQLASALEKLSNEIDVDEITLEEKCLDEPIKAINLKVCEKLSKRIIKSENLATKVTIELEFQIQNSQKKCNGATTLLTSATVNDLGKEIDKATINQCTKEDVNKKNQSCAKEIACSISSTIMGPVLAGYIALTGKKSRLKNQQCLSSENDCLTNVLTSLVGYLVSSVKAVWDLLGMGASWVTEKGKNFWSWVVSAEDETSKTQETIQNLSKKDIQEIENDSEGWFKKTLGGVTSMLNEWIKTEVFCEKWSGTPNFSKCEKPMKGWECIGCGTMISGMCQMAGPVIGLIAETVLTGGSLALISKGSRGVKAGIAAMKSSPKYTSAMTKVKNTGFAQKLVKDKSSTILSSRVPKGQVAQYTKKSLTKVVQISKDKLLLIKKSKIIDKAKEILKKLSNTKVAKVVKKIDEVDTKAFNLGYETVDKGLGNAGKAITNSSKLAKVEVESPPTVKKALTPEGYERYNNLRPDSLTSLKLKSVQTRHKYLQNNRNGADFFHGSSSSSLLMFTGKSKSQGLVPTGQLIKNGDIPFGGELHIGISEKGINQNRLSVTKYEDIDLAVNYSQSHFNTGWNKSYSDKCINSGLNFPGCNPKVELLRQERWKSLDKEERVLVSEGFPVLYGVKPKNPDKAVVSGMISNETIEIGLNSGARADEIKVIFVPENKISSVRKLTEGYSNIEIRSIEKLYEESIDPTVLYQTLKTERRKSSK